MTLADALDDDQRAILDHVLTGHARRIIVESPPGTGKTHAAIICAAETARRALSRHQRVLILTFSATARTQLERYASEWLGPDPDDRSGVEISNFHAFYLKYVWSNRALLGLPSELRLESPAQRGQFLRETLAPYEIEDGKEDEWGSVLDQLISGVEPIPECAGKEKIVEVLQTAILNRNKAGRLYYDDFAYYFSTLAKKDPGLLAVLRYKYPLMILDEYQDSSDAQHMLTELLLGREGRALVFADEMQCIYEWRGARRGRIAGIRDRCDASPVTLTHYHRYTHTPVLLDVLIKARAFLSGQSSERIPVVPGVLELRQPTDGLGPLSPVYEARKIATAATRETGVDSVAVICYANSGVSECRKHFRKYGLYARQVGVQEALHNCIGDLIEDLRGETQLRTTSGILACLEIILAGDEDYDALCKKPQGKFRCCLRRKGMQEAVHRAAGSGKPLVLNLAECLRAIRLLPKCEHRRQMDWEVLAVLQRIADAAARVSSAEEAVEQLTNLFLQEQHLIRSRKPRGVYVLNAHQSKGKEFDVVILVAPVSRRHGVFGFPVKTDEDRRVLYVVLTRAKKRISIIPSAGARQLLAIFEDSPH